MLTFSSPQRFPLLNLVFHLRFLYEQYHGGDRTVDVEVQIPTADGPITKSSTDSYNYTVEQTGVINESLSDLPTTTVISGERLFVYCLRASA